jgi:hypothetical protein
MDADLRRLENLASIWGVDEFARSGKLFTVETGEAT